MQTILDAMERHATHRERDTFCHFLSQCEVVPIDFGTLMRESNRFAGLFHQNGVQAGEVVLIILKHTPDLLYSFLGAMLCGAVPSFMPYPSSRQDPRLYWSAHRALFERIGAGALITYPENVPLLREHIGRLPLGVLQPEAARACSTRYEGCPQPSEAVAFLQHSSGTTGLKKGVALSHAAVLRQVRSYADVLSLSRADRIVSWLPLYHDMGLIACFMLPLLTGVPSVQLDPFEWVIQPNSLFDAIGRFGGTLSWLPNFGFQHLCRTVRPSSAGDLSSMRAWINCSEPCRAETFDAFVQRFSASGVVPEHLQVCYAMAETVFAVTQTRPGGTPKRLAVDAESLRDHHQARTGERSTRSRTVLSTGAPIPGLRVKVVDGDGSLLPDQSVGELAIAGDCMFSGYFRQPEETARKLRGGWYYSGDLGFISEGEVYVTGRKEDLIIVHGRNYYAHELEFLVNQVAGIRPGRGVVAGWFRPEVGTEEVVVIAETDATSLAEQSAVTSAIRETLHNDTGLLPFDVCLVPPGWLIKTTSGKISRGANLTKYLEHATTR